MDDRNRKHQRPPFWRVAQRCCIVAGAIDTAYFFLFLTLDSPALAWINIISVAMYITAYYAYRRRKNQLGSLLIWTEVILHAAFGTILIGWDSGFYYFLLAFIPVLPVSMAANKAIVALLVLWTYFVGLHTLAIFIDPIQPISALGLFAVNTFNLTVVFGIFAYLAFYYIRTVTSAHRKLREHATTDSMTRLFNRRYMTERMQLEAQQATVNQTALSFLLLDIDYFKQINDQYGHHIGDEVLTQAADLLRAELRPNDIAARWGGEEFLIVLPESSNLQAAIVAERIRSAFEDFAWSDIIGEDVSVTISTGIHSMQHNEAISDTIKAADHALYQAKSNGRNRVELSINQMVTE
ncbi:GGDEF domain-containing protein [Rheinheimera salexigens]|uniref:diguanylate cyclase n=1 Tax=Rheinheimera salexigens TaxID=1628148 RepID=A0A1E7Q9F7_9GAMM|nr:GGDEF domain-containing protein [Rheinheimera salexigens]OEY70693.1 diguanylate cyclase [Rheinheimera salexigens]